MARGLLARRTLISGALLAGIGATAFAVMLFSVADLYTNRNVAPSDLKKCSWWATTSSGWSSTLGPDCAGYIIAGQEEFLQPSQAAEASFAQQAATLQQLLADNPAQLARAETSDPGRSLLRWRTLPSGT